MLPAIAPDPDLWVSSNKGHLPFIASARGGGKLRVCGLWEASEIRGDSVARHAALNPLESREPAGQDSGAGISLRAFRSLMTAFLSCRVRQILTWGESIDH